MLPSSLQLRPNFLRLDVVLIKLAPSPMCQKSLWSPTPYTQQGESLPTNCILIKFTLPPYSENCVTSSQPTIPTLLNFGSAPANLDGDSTLSSTGTPNHSPSCLLIRPKFLGIIARKSIATIPSTFGK